MGDPSHQLADGCHLLALHEFVPGPGELLQRVGNGLHRSVHVGFDDEGKRADFPLCKHVGEVAELDATLLDAELLLTIEALTRAGDFSCLIGVHRLEHITRLRHTCGAENLDGNARTDALDVLSALIQ